MSFGKLLAAGKSFVGGKGRGRYQQDPRIALPKFGSRKNPFASAAANETPRHPAPAESESESESGKPVRAVPQPETETEKPARKIELAAAGRWLAGRVQKVNPAKLFKRKPGPARSIPQFERQAVQGELSLDRVQVVRNDLRDADIEVVSLNGANHAMRVESKWDKLASCVFGADSM